MEYDEIFNQSVWALNRLLLATQVMHSRELKVVTLGEAQLLCKIIIYRLSIYEGPEARTNEANFLKQLDAITEELRRLDDE
jgi:hypothetical protein